MTTKVTTKDHENGLGGRARTCDLMLPKHLRCQLRYTEMRDDGSPRRDRTAALLVNSQAIYRLSYRGMNGSFNSARLSSTLEAKVGFEPTRAGADGFADRRLRPLGYVAVRVAPDERHRSAGCVL
jgi:hypothetical protein